MMGTLMTPTSARMAPALSARRGSSMAACRAMNPRYRKNKINCEVRRASHTHQAPHMGLPQREPVNKDRKANMAPVGAKAEAIMPERRVLKDKHMAGQKAMM